VYENAAWALGKLKDSRAFEPLIAALNDSDENFRRDVTEALDSIGWSPNQEDNGKK
jgi:HEAT repeat protein